MEWKFSKEFFIKEFQKSSDLQSQSVSEWLVEQYKKQKVIQIKNLKDCLLLFTGTEPDEHGSRVYSMGGKY